MFRRSPSYPNIERLQSLVVSTAGSTSPADADDLTRIFPKKPVAPGGKGPGQLLQRGDSCRHLA